MSKHKGEMNQPSNNAGHFAKKVGQEASSTANGLTPAQANHDLGGHWIVQESNGRLTRQTNSREQAEEVAARNPGTEVALFMKGVTNDAAHARRLAKISGDIAHVIDNEDVTRVEFSAMCDDDDYGYHYHEVGNLSFYDVNGEDITPDTDDYHDIVDRVESGISNGDMSLLVNTMNNIVIKIR